MHTEVMKWISIAALLLAVLFWSSAPTYQVELNLLVCAASILVLMQAYRAGSRPWAAGFLALALLFNPLILLFRLAGPVGLSLIVLAMAPFAFSLFTLRPQPHLSIPSITDRTPGSLSL